MSIQSLSFCILLACLCNAIWFEGQSKRFFFFISDYCIVWKPHNIWITKYAHLLVGNTGNVIVRVDHTTFSGVSLFIGSLIKLLVLKSCIAKESLSVCVQTGLTWIAEAYIEAYTNNKIPNCVIKKHFWINKLMWEQLISPFKVRKLTKW